MVAFVRNLGTNSSTSTTATTLAITIPAAGAAAGDLVVVRFGGYNYTSGTVSCADSKSNTYQSDWADNSASDGINTVFSSILTTALVSGDTITVTFPSGNQQYAITADEFSGIASSGWAWQVGTKATGTSTTPSDSITPGASPPASTLVLGVLFASLGPSDTFTEDTTNTAGGDSWHSLTASIATAGANQEGTRSAYKIPTAGNTGVAQTWAPTLGTSHFWVENLIIYKGSSTPSGTGSAALTLGSSGAGTPAITGTGSAALSLSAAVSPLATTSNVGMGPTAPNPNWPLLTYDVDFTQGPPTVPGVNRKSINAGANRNVVRQVDIRRGRQYELDQVQAGECRMTVTDPNEVLNPQNTSSPFMTGGNTIKPYRALQVAGFWNTSPKPLNSNTTFETGTSPWTVTNGTLAQAALPHTGIWSALVTPNGTSATCTLTSEQVPVTGQVKYTATAWSWFTAAVTSNVTVSLNWYNASGALLSTSTGTAASASAQTWTQFTSTVEAPIGAATASMSVALGGTPAVGQLWYVDDAVLSGPVGGTWGNQLASSNPIPGQPSLGTNINYGNDPSFTGWYTVGPLISTDGTTVTTNPPMNSNPNFEQGTAPWTVTGAAVAQSSTQSRTGTWSARITPDGVSAQGYIASELAPVTGSATYTATGWAWFTNAVTSNYSMKIDWYDSTRTIISTSAGTAISASATTWTQTTLTAAAPSTAVYARMYPVLAGTPAASQVWYVDDATMFAGSAPADGPYAVTTVSAAASSSYAAWIPRATPNYAFTLTVDVWAATNVTVKAGYGATNQSTTASGQWQTLTLNVTGNSGYSWIFSATTTGAYPAVFYLANFRVSGPMPGWSTTAGGGTAYTPIEAHTSTYSNALSFASSSSTVTLPVATVPGFQYTMSSYVWAQTAGTVATMTAAGSSVSSTVVNQWQRIAVTFTATDAVTNVQWTATASAYPATVYLDDIQLELGSLLSTFTLAGPARYPLYSGYVERYPLRYDMAGTRGIRPLQAVDALAILSRTQVTQSYAATIQSDSPYGYVPYNDQGLPQAVQIPKGGQPFTGYQSLGTQGSVNFQGDSFLDGSRAVTVVQQNANPPVSNNTAYITFLGTINGSQMMNPQAFTIELWLKFSGGAAALGAAWVPSTENPNTEPAGPQNMVGWSFDPDGALYWTFQDPAGSNSYYAYTPPGASANGFFADGMWHYLAFTCIGSNQFVATFDGNNSGAQGFTTPSQTSTAMRLNNLFAQVTTYYGAQVSDIAVANMAIYPTALTATQRGSHFQRGTGYLNEVSGSRVVRLLNQYWGGVQGVGAGYLKMAPDYGYNGRMLLDVLQEIQESERGLTFANASGAVIVEDRTTRYTYATSKTSQWTLGENPSGAAPVEYPYSAYEGDYDPQFTFSQANLSRPGNSSYPPVSNAQAKTDYGQRILTQTLQANTDFDLQQAGVFYLNRYSTPKTRVERLVLNPAANPALWPVVLGLEISQRFTVKRRTAALTTSNDYYIEQINHRIDADKGTWLVEVQMSPVFNNSAWILGDATYGVLGTTSIPVY